MKHGSEVMVRERTVVDARIYPGSGLDLLSRVEVARLRDVSSGGYTSCCAVAHWRS